MSTVGTHAWTRIEHPAPPGPTATLRAEWVKFWTVRSTPWSLAAMFVVGLYVYERIIARWFGQAELDEGAPRQ